MTATAVAFLDKADKALAAAAALSGLGDADGAANRAYYAMYSAACAALLASGAVDAAGLPRTHSGLRHAFSLHLVKAGRLDKSFDRALAQVEGARRLADYSGDRVESDIGDRSVEYARTFVAAVRRMTDGD